MPPLMSNHGIYISASAALCRWLAKEGRSAWRRDLPGLCGRRCRIGPKGEVIGVITGDMGVARDGHHKPNYTPGMAFAANIADRRRCPRFAREKMIARYGLADGRAHRKPMDLGLKELWELPKEKHRPGLVMHTMGWPLDNHTGGGSFFYHYGDNLASVGFVVHLDYRNPYLWPFDEFQRFKTHPMIRPMLEGGRRIGYGARAITEGGFQAVPKLAFPGGALIGCSAGFVNLPRIKGSHNAI